ncbi:MAG TPA: regulatory signaling modulator protein AmpE [Thioalkalivibrio sp.]|nr:regulatory signaling modulator protein AmpE [Thioalkalivibrio sp.]
MTLITVLIGLVLERFVGYLDEFRQLGWFRRYGEWLQARLGGVADGVAGVVLILAGPALLIWGVAALLDDVLLGLLEIAFGVVVLLYTLGPRDLNQDVESYVEACNAGDEERINLVTARLVDGPVPEEPVARLRAVVEAVFTEANSRLMAVLFWFVILGPLGAVVYRLSHELVRNAAEDSSLQKAATHWLALVDWVPARLVALFYALTGHFEDTLPALRRHLTGPLEELSATNRALLAESGTASLEFEELVEEELDATQVSVILKTAINMVMRTLVLAITMLAVATLGGWTS